MDEPDLPRLAGTLPRRAIAEVYARVGRVHVPGILEPACAERVTRALEHETPWSLSLLAADGNRTLSPETLATLTPEQWRTLEGAVHAKAARGFQYLYRNFPLYDEYHAGRYRDHPLARVYEFLNSPPFLDFAREVTGVRGITHVDAQATCYERGHFLTEHDDRDDAKRRVAAYVLNFTREWRADWGGELAFVAPDGHVAEAYTPAFNALNLFRVPQRHFVGCVAPFAPRARYSITGWIRADRAPAFR